MTIVAAFGRCLGTGRYDVGKGGWVVLEVKTGGRSMLMKRDVARDRRREHAAPQQTSRTPGATYFIASRRWTIPFWRLARPTKRM